MVNIFIDKIKLIKNNVFFEKNENTKSSFEKFSNFVFQSLSAPPPLETLNPMKKKHDNEGD